LFNVFYCDENPSICENKKGHVKAPKELEGGEFEFVTRDQQCKICHLPTARSTIHICCCWGQLLFAIGCHTTYLLLPFVASPLPRS